MIEFLLAHPYLTIWVSLILMFERAMYCGYVVDDQDMRACMSLWKKELNDKKNWSFKFFLNFLYYCFYSCGIFRNAKQEHLFTLLLHGVNCSLIYRMTGSLLATLLYLINPINNQTAIWLNGRRYAISLFAVLIAWNFWYLAPIMMLYLYFHVSIAPMPLLFMFSPMWLLTPLLIAIGSIFGFKRVVSHTKSRGSQYQDCNENKFIRWKKIILYVKSVGYNFINCVLPLKPSMYHDFLYYFSSTYEGNKDGYSFNLDFWKGVAVVGLLSYLIIWQHSFWAFWYVIFISPWCNIRQVTMNASDRYCSIPNVGVMCLLAEYLIKLPDPYRIMAISFFACLYILKYCPLFMAYRNVENFFLYHINLQPNLINPRFFLSKHYLFKRDPFSAFAVIKQGMKYRPYDFKFLLAFIECLFALGKPKAAFKAMDVAEKHIPIGEEIDTQKLFSGLRSQFNFKKVYHNNGQPYVNPDKKKKGGRL